MQLSSLLSTSHGRLSEFFVFFTVQTCQYALIVANMRAVVIRSYLWMSVTDAFLASMSFLILKRIAERKDTATQALGYVLGSVTGGILGLWISTK